MYCFETIRVQDGIPQHLHYHDLRLNRTRKALFGIEQEIALVDYLTGLPSKGLYRAKVIYDAERISVHYYRYRPKSITTLYLVEADIDYSYKYLDRTPIAPTSLLDAVGLREYAARGCDFSRISATEVAAPKMLNSIAMPSPLFTQNGLLTDTAIANIALREDGIWYTPATPLLPGTTRARLLDSGRLQLRDIHRDTLGRYDGFALMNAMIGFSIVNPEFLAPHSLSPIQGKPCP